MQNQRLSLLLVKLEAAKRNETEEDQIVSINDELAKNIRAVYGSGNGVCQNNTDCSDNGSCHNNGTCHGPNGTCDGSCGAGLDSGC
jgi:hypothetical protein